MSLEWQVLGRPGADNALHVVVDSGQRRESLLFDCGEHCLDGLRTAEIQEVAHLFFSHFHMDHVAGFDGFFRQNYNRPAPVGIWGPPGTIGHLQHRFQGFVWNLHEGQPGEWVVREIGAETVETARFLTTEAFALRRDPSRPREGDTVHESTDWFLEARLLPHGSIPSAAYRIVEKPRHNIDPASLGRSGNPPGPWLQSVVGPGPDSEVLEVGGSRRPLREWRRELLLTTPGESLAWLTDFRVEPGTEAWRDLVAWLSGSTTMVCECQYRDGDEALAKRNAHLTAGLAGRLAAEAGVGRLVLQHFSRRYTASDWPRLRDEARIAFPRAELPRGWTLA